MKTTYIFCLSKDGKNKSITSFCAFIAHKCKLKAPSLEKKISEHSATAGHEIKTRKISEDPGLDNSGLNSCRLVFTDEKIIRRKGRRKNVRAGRTFELTAAVVGFDILSVRVCVSGRFCSSSRANSSCQHGPTRGIGSTRET